MTLILHAGGKLPVGEFVSESILLKTEQDGHALLEEIFASGVVQVMLHQENIAAEFFELQNGLAGAVLQKFVNYAIQLAIIGDFSQVESKSLKAFIYESNRSRHVFFLESVPAAMAKFQSEAG